MIKFILNTTDITNYIQSATWGGSDTQTSRTLDFTVIYNTIHSFDNITVKLGDIIKLYNGKSLLYCGVITKRERSDAIGTVSYCSYDFMHYLLRSSTSKNFKNTTAERITQNICGELNIQTGSLAKTNVPISKLLLEDDLHYNGIIKAYRKAAQQTGKKYIPLMDGKKVSVIEKGKASGVTLDGNLNITGAKYSDTTENMINRVIIYDDKGVKCGTVSNSNNISKYGIYQSTYTKEEKVNASTAAKNMLTGITKSASVDALGDLRAISGYSINIKDKSTGLVGAFFIVNDTHTFEGGNHTMSLELAFKNTMESV